MNKILIVALFSILGAALVKSELNKEEMMKEFMEFAHQCMTENGATEADVDDMIKKKPSASKEAKCMLACIVKKYKLFNANGKIDKAVELEYAKLLSDGDAEKLKIGTEIVNTCTAISVPDDICEAAEVYGKCFLEQAKAHGIDDNFF